jgi:hypothetical protein
MDPLGPSFTLSTTTADVEETTDPPVVESPDEVEELDAAPATAPTSELIALSEVLVRIAEVQTELKDIATDASDGAALLQARSFDQQDRAHTGALLLYVGVLTVALGLVVMWATRPTWPPPR